MSDVQRRLSQGQTPAQIGRTLGILPDTINKAIKSGRLYRLDSSSSSVSLAVKSDRSIADRAASMGLACTREGDRTRAALGDLHGADPVFEPNQDVSSAGVMLALPGLLANGLLQFSDKHFRLPPGFYSLPSLLLVLAFTALLRIKSLEGVRYVDVGELGKTIGLDRIPEVKTLREKVSHLSDTGQVGDWGGDLSQLWMAADPDLAGMLYVDGHVRVYHGSQTRLPKRYVSRERLCLRGVTDYWVNDGVGQPFFVVNKVVDPGLLNVLETDIIPRLLVDVPGQPTAEELAADPNRSRFGIVFDREGFSPAFFKKMWQDHRVACSTYAKNVKDLLPDSDFKEQMVTLVSGEQVLMMISEREVYHEPTKFWYREIRRKTDSGHQTVIFTTDFYHPAGRTGGHMFSRWSQENFFKYMMEHYGIDRLTDYQLQETGETILLVNPAWRKLDSSIRSLKGKLTRKRSEFGGLVLEKEIRDKAVKDFVRRKSTLKDAIAGLEKKIGRLNKDRKETDHHITFDQLPSEDQFKSLKSRGKQFIDTIKMIAYRAETAMVNIIREEISQHTAPGSSRRDEVRAIVRQILTTDADILPDQENQTLHVKLHNLTNQRNNRYAQKLCQVLNESETTFPGTKLKLSYELVSNQIPEGQGV